MKLIDAIKYVLQKNEVAMTVNELKEEIAREHLLQINGKLTDEVIKAELTKYCDGVQQKKNAENRFFYRIRGNLYGLLDWLDDEGVEKEINSEDITKPFDVTKIDITSEPITVDLIIKKIDYNELVLYPEFQRNKVWNPRQKSRLIESILLRIPIPVFYIDARNEDKWIVIDGLQRLSSLHDYFKGKYALQELEFLRVLEDSKYEKLERKFQRRIEECQLLFYKVRPDTPEEIAFNIFTRINTLGSPLSSQEIRHALHIGPATELLKQLAETMEFRKAIGDETAGNLSRRMKDRELILRMIAFKLNGIEGYNRGFDEFLNRTMKQINKMSQDQIEELKKYFKDSMSRASMVFSEYAFRKSYSNTSRRSPVSKTLFETFGIVLMDYSVNKLKENKEEIFNLFQEKLENDIGYFNSLSINTNSINEIRVRFNKAKEIIDEAIGKR